MKKPPTKSKRTTKPRRKTKSSVTKSKVTQTPAQPVSVVPEPEATLVAPPKPVVSKAAMKKKDLIEKVVVQSGMKKKDVKPVVEATLAVLGEALANDQELNLPPFAKMKIQKVKQLSTARVTIARLRQNGPKPDS